MVKEAARVVVYAELIDAERAARAKAIPKPKHNRSTSPSRSRQARHREYLRREVRRLDRPTGSVSEP